MLLSNFLLSALAVFSPLAHAAFSLTHDDNNFIVDAGSSNSLVVKINRASCDITSILYRGEELGPISALVSVLPLFRAR